MTLRLILTSAAIVLLARAGNAQDPFHQVQRLLESGKEREATARLARAIDTTTGSARTRLLDRGYTGFRERGLSAAWLRTLDAALASDPDDVELLWFRAYTRIDLKLLDGAREDLQRATTATSNDDRIKQGLGWVAALSFQHADAARHLAGIDPSESARHADIVSSLDAARTRQFTGLVIGLCLVASVALAAWRAAPQAPSA